MAEEARGLFVSFEGVDGSGKSTQARLLADALRADGREVVLTREPGGSPGAEEIRRLVLTGDRARWSAETEILLFTAARRDHLERTIRPALSRGAVVVTDRFADSTRLYQGVSRGDLRGVVDQLHDLMIGVEPDLTVLVDMDPRKALARSLERLDSSPARQAAEKEMRRAQRVTAATLAADQLGTLLTEEKEASLWREDLPEDRFESFGLPFQEKVRAGFLALAREHPARIAVVDGDRPEAEVAAEILALVHSRL